MTNEKPKAKKCTIIRVAHVKAMARAAGRRVGADFIDQLERHVVGRIEAALAQHNGGKKTLDQAVAVWVGLKG